MRVDLPQVVRQIKEALHGGNGAPRVEASAFQHLEALVATRVGIDVQPVLLSSLIKAYPDAPLSANAHYYMGEIDYRGAHYSTAVKDYDKVIEQFPDSNKVPAAHLHKGQALVEMQLREAGIREFRSLIQRFPNSPEAAQARTKINILGAAPAPKAR